MLPLCLRLKNFLSYREPPPLDMRGMRVVCLSGNNGHGKSALLDAISWALWGNCSRGRNADALVHRGQQEMEVELEFLLDDRTYRVRRLYQRAGPRRSSQSRLAFQVCDAPGQWRDISGNTLRETQQIITHHLGMDYETFVHTAYLLQGEADRFARLEAQERRRLLATILGLDIYQHALEAVKEQARTLKGQTDTLRQERERLQQDVARRPAVEADLARLHEDLAQLAPRLERLRTEVNTLRLQERTLLTLKSRQEEQRRQAEAWEQEAKTLLEKAQQVEREIHEIQTLLQRQEDIQNGYKRYQHATQRLQALEQACQEFDRLTQEIAQAEKAIAEEKARLERDLTHLGESLQKAQHQAQAIPTLEKALASLAQTADALAQKKAEADALQAQIDRLREEASAHEAKAQQTRKEMETLRQRLNMLLAQAEPVCPLCKTPLGTEGKAHLEEEITAQGKALRQEYDAAQSAAQQARQQAQALAQKQETLRRTLEQERTEVYDQRAKVAKDLEIAREAQKQAQDLAAKAQSLQERLAQDNFAQKERQRLTQARLSLQALGYDPQTYQSLRQEVQRLQHYLQEMGRLEQAQRQLPRLHATLESLRQTALQRQHDAHRAREEAHQAEEALQHLPTLTANLNARQRELEDLEKQRDRLHQEEGRLRQALQDIEEKEHRLRTLQHQSVALEKDLAAYTLLERAFSPQGIPIRIIDSVVHELSDTATQILQRLTNGQMALRIETTRPTKAGEAAETLEVRIDDGYGERPYELFSGGERFRIDFALRLALSRLLAQRSGRPIRTLFIDEGFGTQDAEGRLRLVEAVQAIRNDFDLILVITHMEDLKEHFPTRIEVTRTSNGSWYEVVETP